jgi:hypothetical protein
MNTIGTTKVIIPENPFTANQMLPYNAQSNTAALLSFHEFLYVYSFSVS